MFRHSRAFEDEDPPYDSPGSCRSRAFEDEDPPYDFMDSCHSCSLPTMCDSASQSLVSAVFCRISAIFSSVFCGALKALE